MDAYRSQYFPTQLLPDCLFSPVLVLFLTWIIFLTEINLTLFQVKKIIQVLNSIPRVRCASDQLLQLLQMLTLFWSALFAGEPS